MDDEQANGLENTVQEVRAFIQSSQLLDEWPAYHRMLSESIEQKPAWLFTLPVISCLAGGGKSIDAIPVAATWVALDHASHLLDAVGDGDFQPDEFLSSAAQALNFSTSLIFAAYHFLSYIREPESARRVMSVFSDAGFKATLGQHISFSQLETLPVEQAIEQYWRMVILKSGSIFRMGTAGGAAAGTADKDLIDALGDYGTAIGVIMQMMDDCRDMLDISTGDYEVSLPVLLYSLTKGSEIVVYPEARSTEAMVKVLQDAHVPEMIAALLQEWQKNALDSLRPLRDSSMLDILKSVLHDVSKLPLMDCRNT
jgi:hypothetical protein